MINSVSVACRPTAGQTRDEATARLDESQVRECALAESWSLWECLPAVQGRPPTRFRVSEAARSAGTEWRHRDQPATVQGGTAICRDKRITRGAINATRQLVGPKFDSDRSDSATPI